jgi:hypothetical protein
VLTVRPTLGPILARCYRATIPSLVPRAPFSGGGLGDGGRMVPRQQRAETFPKTSPDRQIKGFAHPIALPPIGLPPGLLEDLCKSIPPSQAFSEIQRDPSRALVDLICVACKLLEPEINDRYVKLVSI